MVVNYQVEEMNAAVAYFMLLCKHLLVGTEESQENSQSEEPVSRITRITHSNVIVCRYLRTAVLLNMERYWPW
jgi:hypothetical protein